MGLNAWAERLSVHRRGFSLIALLLAFTGVSLVLNPSHAADLVVIGVILVAVGSALVAIALWPTTPLDTAIAARSLGARLIYRLTWGGRLIRFFPGFGIAIIGIDLAYNFFLSAQPALLTEDILVLLSAGALLGYGLVPRKYARERDFVLLFFFFLNLLLVVPLLIVRAVTDSADASVDIYSWTALAPELGALLSVLGIPNSVHGVVGSTAPGLTFIPVHVNAPVTLVITTACSGIYSFGIFAAAYLSFLSTEYSRPSRRLLLLIGLGFVASYLANLLRMLVIVLVGYYSDTVESNLQNLLLAHSYAGWIIFLGWLSLFWGLLFKFLPLEDETPESLGEQRSEARRSRVSLCGICSQPLSPAIAATRCVCGAFHHSGCLAASGECPVCHQKAPTPRSRVVDGG